MDFSARKRFSGSIPALVTPFRGGELDEVAFRRLVSWQIEQGTNALVPCGTTGESATLTMEEHHKVIRWCVQEGAGRVPVIAGCGSNDTATALAHLARAADAGADAALVVAPYYNRPSRAGQLAHFTTLAEASRIPIILYNVPGRTVTDLSVETVAELARLPNIIGIKDASGQIDRASAHRLACGPDFIQLSGNDDMALAFNAVGGMGCISVTANVAPALCAEFQQASLAGDLVRARALEDRLFPLHKAMFADASPGPVKYAMTRLFGWMPLELRLPMVAPGAITREQIDAALRHAGLL